MTTITKTTPTNTRRSANRLLRLHTGGGAGVFTPLMQLRPPLRAAPTPGLPQCPTYSPGSHIIAMRWQTYWPPISTFAHDWPAQPWYLASAKSATGPRLSRLTGCWHVAHIFLESQQIVASNTSTITDFHTAKEKDEWLTHHFPMGYEKEVWNISTTIRSNYVRSQNIFVQ
jgi:hypothetical protein